MATSRWENLLEDIYLRVLDCFDYKERVKYTVLVCKRWSTLCLQNPPEYAELAFQLQSTAVSSYLTWLAQSSRHAEKLYITTMTAKSTEEGYPCLPRQSLNNLLAILSTGSPLLRTLAIKGPPQQDEFKFQDEEDSFYMRQGYRWEHWGGTLPLLRQVEHLVLEVEFAPLIGRPNTVPQEIFMGMKLKSLSLAVVERGYGCEPHTEALEVSLRDLTRLTCLKLKYMWRPANEDNVRSLHYKSNMAIFFTPGMSNLAKLSANHLSGPMAGYSTIGTLKAPSLQELVLDFSGSYRGQHLPNPVLPLFRSGALTSLTKLEISTFMQFRQADVPFLLPEAALRQLTGLVHLALRLDHPDLFSPSLLEVPLARITPFLTYLDLSKSGFHSIPTAVTGLERLQHLKILKCPLELRQDCLAVLKSLPKLRTLELKKEEWSKYSAHSPISAYHSWDSGIIEVMNSIRVCLPELDVQVRALQRGV